MSYRAPVAARYGDPFDALPVEELKSHQASNTEQLRILARRKLRKMSQIKSTLKALLLRFCVADCVASAIIRRAETVFA